jgi:hypothetical protein
MLDLSNVRVISSIMGQSVALEHFDRLVIAAIERFTPVLSEIASKGVSKVGAGRVGLAREGVVAWFRYLGVERKSSRGKQQPRLDAGSMRAPLPLPHAPVQATPRRRARGLTARRAAAPLPSSCCRACSRACPSSCWAAATRTSC